MVVVLGDFDARVGTDTNTWHTVLGPHGMGQVNGNGQRLLDFCATNKLLITNTWYRHKPKHQCTWYRNGDRSNPGHMIDYVLVSAKYRTSILDTRIYRGVHHQSDHELVVRFKIKAKRRQCHHPPPPSDQVSTTGRCIHLPCLSSSCLRQPPPHLTIQVLVHLMLLMSGPPSKQSFRMPVTNSPLCQGGRRPTGSLMK